MYPKIFYVSCFSHMGGLYYFISCAQSTHRCIWNTEKVPEYIGFRYTKDDSFQKVD